MASEDRLRELEEKYEDYKVYDNQGERIGKVDDLFVDETDREEYIGVKMGSSGLKSTLIPMDIVRVNEGERTIEVSESKNHVRNAPSFDDDEDITADYEDRIRSHFGLESVGTSPRGGYGAYSAASTTRTGSASRKTTKRKTIPQIDLSSADPEYGERPTTESGEAPETQPGSRESPLRDDRPSVAQGPPLMRRAGRRLPRARPRRPRPSRRADARRSVAA